MLLSTVCILKIQTDQHQTADIDKSHLQKYLSHLRRVQNFPIHIQHYMLTCSQIPTEHIFILTSAKKHYSTFPETGGRIISDGRTASVGRLLHRSSAMAASTFSGFSLGFGLQSCKQKFAIVKQQLLLTK
jgi:hypothetical protein